MATSIRPQTAQCPECQNPVEQTATEVVCPACGLVVDDSPIDHGPEYRSFADGPDRERDKPGNRNLPDRGLGSEVGDGRSGSPDLQRKRRWHEQARSGDREARTRTYATTEIQRMSVALGLGDALAKQAKHLFRQLHEGGHTVGRCLDALAATCVYTTSRVHKRGLVPSAVATVSRACDGPQIARRHTWVSRTLGVPVPPPDVAQRIRVVASDSDHISDRVRDRAVRLSEAIDDAEHCRGSPSTLAAALLYEAGDHLTQAEAAEAAGVTDTALRSRWHRLDVDRQTTLEGFDGA